VFQQLWLFLPDRLIGLMLSVPTEPTRARSVEHHFRFFGETLSAATAEGTYATDELRLRIIDTNLEYRLIEPARRYCMGTNEPDRQLALCDVPRLPAKEARGKPKDDPVHLPERPFLPAQPFHSLVEIARRNAAPGEVHLARAAKNLLCFRCQVGGRSYVALINFSSTPETLPIGREGSSVVAAADAVEVLVGR